MSANELAGIEILDSRAVRVGGLPVRRSLPRRGRRSVGAWCFVDHLGPVPVTKSEGPGVGPHPHMGLQTVTWLIEGEALHLDSLGSEQLIRPGELNLMTAGAGLSHAEESTSHYAGMFHGVQLWVALPESTRISAPEFSHFVELPKVELQGSPATVLVGEMFGQASPARYDTPLVGVDLEVNGRVDLPLRSDFEYAIVPLDGELRIDGRLVRSGELAYLAPGRTELGIAAEHGVRTMLLGGEPLRESILMWWNFVARTREEIDSAFFSWQTDDGRFGQVESALPRIPAPPPYWQPR